jgi:hypothetical protein
MIGWKIAAVDVSSGATLVLAIQVGWEQAADSRRRAVDPEQQDACRNRIESEAKGTRHVARYEAEGREGRAANGCRQRAETRCNAGTEEIAGFGCDRCECWRAWIEHHRRGGRGLRRAWPGAEHGCVDPADLKCVAESAGRSQ